MAKESSSSDWEKLESLCSILLENITTPWGWTFRLQGRSGEVDIMHVCFPFQIKDFVGETARYIELYHPALTVINSTVAVGTTRAIAIERASKL